MHEGNFTQQIVDSILAELQKYPDHRPKLIKVKVGEMLHLEEESVRSHYEVLVKGTRLEGTVLELEEVPAMIRCRRCGLDGGLEDHHLLVCPACSSHDVELLSGDDVLIESIEIER